MELLSTGQDPGEKVIAWGNSSVMMKISAAEIQFHGYLLHIECVRLTSGIVQKKREQTI